MFERHKAVVTAQLSLMLLLQSHGASPEAVRFFTHGPQVGMVMPVDSWMWLPLTQAILAHHATIRAHFYYNRTPPT